LQISDIGLRGEGFEIGGAVDRCKLVGYTRFLTGAACLRSEAVLGGWMIVEALTQPGYVFSRTSDFAVLVAGHGQDARGTDTARMAVPHKARGTGVRNEEAPPTGGGANQRSRRNLALDGG
jgi:hypothetical protein